MLQLKLRNAMRSLHSCYQLNLMSYFTECQSALFRCPYSIILLVLRERIRNNYGVFLFSSHSTQQVYHSKLAGPMTLAVLRMVTELHFIMYASIQLSHKFLSFISLPIQSICRSLSSGMCVLRKIYLLSEEYTASIFRTE